MTRGTAWFAVLGLFLAGIAIGALTVLLVAGPPPDRPGPPPPGPPHEEMRLERLAASLELDDAQRERIATILGDAHAEAQLLRTELAPRLESLMARTDERIREVLEEEQRARFDELRTRRRSTIDRFLIGGHGRGARGPGPRGGGRRVGAP